jgi:hypothetical protein
LLFLYYLLALILSGAPIASFLEHSQGTVAHIGIQALSSSYQGDYAGSLTYTRQALRDLPEESYFLKSLIASASAAVLL